MPMIVVNTRFKIAVSQGNEVISFEPGVHEVSDRVAEVAIKHLKVAKPKSKTKGGENVDIISGKAAAEN